MQNGVLDYQTSGQFISTFKLTKFQYIWIVLGLIRGVWWCQINGTIAPSSCCFSLISWQERIFSKLICHYMNSVTLLSLISRDLIAWFAHVTGICVCSVHIAQVNLFPAPACSISITVKVYHPRTETGYICTYSQNLRGCTVQIHPKSSIQHGDYPNGSSGLTLAFIKTLADTKIKVKPHT